MEAQGLEQLIEDLRERGIQAGREEADRIIREAKEKAAKIVEEARQEAEKTKKEAQAEIQKLRHQMQAELRSAADAALAAFRQTLVKSFALPTVMQDVEAVVSKPEFLEKLISEVIQAFVSSGFSKSDLEVLLPEARKKELEGYLVTRLKAKAGPGLTISWGRIRFGFRIKTGGTVEYDFTDEAFREIFLNYINKKFAEYFRKPQDQGKGA